MDRVIRLLGEWHYDVCVMTGDYRAASLAVRTMPHSPELARIRARIKDPIYGVTRQS